MKGWRKGMVRGGKEPARLFYFGYPFWDAYLQIWTVTDGDFAWLHAAIQKPGDGVEVACSEKIK